MLFDEREKLISIFWVERGLGLDTPIIPLSIKVGGSQIFLKKLTNRILVNIIYLLNHI